MSYAKKNGQTTNHSENNIAAYREEETDIRSKIDAAQTSLDVLTVQIAEKTQQMNVANSKIHDALAALENFNRDLEAKKAALKKEIDDELKDKTDRADTLLSMAQTAVDKNKKEAERLALQKQAQDSAQQILDRDKAAAKSEADTWNTRFNTQQAELNKKKTELDDLVQQNEDILGLILQAKKDSQIIIEKLEAKKLEAVDIDQKIADNNALIQALKEAQEKLDTSKQELEAKEKALAETAKSNQNMIDQIKLRQESQDAREESLNNREQICAEKEARLAKGDSK